MIYTRLTEEMRAYEWPVTFSIGVVTFASPPQSADEIIRLADDLMYAVKKGGRNGVMFQVYSY
jgi:PleD family two-component response regulator